MGHIKSSHRLQVNSYTDMNISKYSTQITRKSVYLYEYCSNMPNYELRVRREIYIFCEIFHLIYFHTTYSIIIKLCVSKCTRSTPSYDSFDFDQVLFRWKILAVKGNVSEGGLSVKKKSKSVDRHPILSSIYFPISLDERMDLTGIKNNELKHRMECDKEQQNIVDCRKTECHIESSQQWCIHK